MIPVDMNSLGSWKSLEVKQQMNIVQIFYNIILYICGDLQSQKVKMNFVRIFFDAQHSMHSQCYVLAWCKSHLYNTVLYINHTHKCEHRCKQQQQRKKLLSCLHFHQFIWDGSMCFFTTATILHVLYLILMILFFHD